MGIFNLIKGHAVKIGLFVQNGGGGGGGGILGPLKLSILQQKCGSTMLNRTLAQRKKVLFFYLQSCVKCNNRSLHRR